MSHREEKEHKNHMKEFDKDYQATKETVWNRTRQYQAGSRKKVLLGVGCFLVIMVCILMAEAEPLEKTFRRWWAGNHYETVAGQIQEYLDQGAYGELFDYGEQYHLTDSEKGKFADYYDIFWCAWRYDETEYQIESFLGTVDYDNEQIRESYLQGLSDSLSSFYQETWPDQYPEKDREIYVTMRDRMKQLLKEKLLLPDETAERIDGMTSAGIYKLLGERYQVK